jgi:hypothetical protein
MFKYKTDAEVQAMTEQEANDYAVAKRAHESELQTKAIDSAVKSAKDEFAVELKKANDNATELALKVTQMETKGDGNNSIESQLKTALQENHEAIKNIAKAGSGMVEITLKVPNTVTTASGINTAPPAITGTQQAPISNLMLRR